MTLSTRAVNRPTRLSSVVAVLAATASVALVATASGQRLGALIALAGAAVLGLGAALHYRGYWAVGLPLTLVGVTVSLSAVGVGVALTPSTRVTERVELVGLLGIPLIALGVVPLSRRFARRLVSAGTAFLVVGTVASGLLRGTGLDPVPLLASLAAAVVAWDAGEQAIGLGEQLGRRARTWPVEAAHTAGTACVGGLGVGAAMLVQGVNVTDLPIEALLLLLAAAVALLVALYE